MSDDLRHKCGIALIRLRKPLSYYHEKYGSPMFGLNRLFLLMEKQHNRGQDGAGIATVKLDTDPGVKYLHRLRSVASRPIQDIVYRINSIYERANNRGGGNPDSKWLKKNMDFYGELMLGHLRYGTYGSNTASNCHPVVRQNNWRTRNLAIAANFNLTNVNELFDELLDLGQHPKERSDTVTVLEKIGHFLDEENERIYQHYKNEGLDKREISSHIAKELDIQRIIERSCKKWDGGYAIAGVMGHGDAFVLRDPHGIRPAYFYQNDEFIMAASERPALQTICDGETDDIREIDPGHVLILKKDGTIKHVPYCEPQGRKACSFERIYFSRGNDRDIYKERKTLGKQLAEPVLKAINYDLKNTVFSFIPNTAETAFYGLVESVDKYLNEVKTKKLIEPQKQLSREEIADILSYKTRVEKVALKDVKLRTFIANDNQRDEMAGHVYDITYDSISRGKDSLVMLDDSIVRGTTLKQSILRILDRLGPIKIFIVSSSPQIRYPDCYGIDMAKIQDFAAFKAAIELLKMQKKEELINEVYNLCKRQENIPNSELKNHVKKIYAPFTDEQISDKISAMMKTPEINADIHIIYQTIEGLHQACPEHSGDWYFSGDYPTPGGNRVVNTSFINFVEGRNQRAYQEVVQ